MAAELAAGAEVVVRPNDRPDEEAGAAAVRSGAGAGDGGLTPAELAAEVAILGREKPPLPASSSI